ADDRALETELISQDVVQQPAVRVRGHAVDLVVRRHDVGGVSARNGSLERRAELLAQHSLRDLRRTDVRAALRLTMTRHVCDRGKDMSGLEPELERRVLALEALDRSNDKLADEVGILSVRFFDPAPTRIASNIDDRPQHKLYATSGYFSRDHCK